VKNLPIFAQITHPLSEILEHGIPSESNQMDWSCIEADCHFNTQGLSVLYPELLEQTMISPKPIANQPESFAVLLTIILLSCKILARFRNATPQHS